jgi:hypothetical protein
VHFPFIANRPFFMVTFCSSFISFLLLHFTQYPVSAICRSFFKSPRAWFRQTKQLSGEVVIEF